MASNFPPGFEGALQGSFPVLHHIPLTNVPKKAQESKKVSWASEDILCQVRLFAAEDSPAQSNSTIQEMLLPKKARFMHMINPVVHADLPPGFGPSAQMGLKPAVVNLVPQVLWRTPDRYKMDSSWLVMAGEESKEMFAQRQRENRTLEAVYPRPSAIPESPAEPSEPQFQVDEDDANTLIIPVVPSDDDDSPDPDDAPTTSGSAYEILEEFSYPREKPLSPPPGFNLTSLPPKSRSLFPGVSPLDSMSSLPASSPSHPFGPPSTTILPPNGGIPAPTASTTTNARNPGEGADVAAAAAAAYAALSQSNDTTMIDRELLIKFLTNPSMLQSLSEKLAQNPPGASDAGNGGSRKTWNPTSESKRYTDPHSAYDRPPGFGAYPASQPPSLRPAQALPPQSISPSPAQGSGSVRQRDDQYFKDLISQHGTKHEETLWGGGAGFETETSFGGRSSSSSSRANGHERDRKAEKAERAERSERLDSGARWVERDVDMMDVSRSGEESRRGKSRKACIYFTTSRGCRNGNSCAFVHESTNAERANKRPKVEGKESSKGYRYSS